MAGRRQSRRLFHALGARQSRRISSSIQSPDRPQILHLAERTEDGRHLVIYSTPGQRRECLGGCRSHKR